MIPLQIKHPEVKQYYDYLISIYRNETIDKETRIDAAVKLNLIEQMALIYEENEPLTFEEDLSWNEVGRPLLIEEKRECLKNLRLITGGKNV